MAKLTEFHRQQSPTAFSPGSKVEPGLNARTKASLSASVTLMYIYVDHVEISLFCLFFHKALFDPTFHNDNRYLHDARKICPACLGMLQCIAYNLNFLFVIFLFFPKIIASQNLSKTIPRYKVELQSCVCCRDLQFSYKVFSIHVHDFKKLYMQIDI
jgi:hypothetical protein